MKSRVLYKGHNSNWFDVIQGTRQGGVLSPFLFLCFSYDLLNELCNSTAGLKICNNIFGCPTVCDDMLLASLSKKGLQEQIQICFLTSCKSKFEFIRTDRVWHIGNNQVEEDENYKHLGIVQNKYLSLKPCIKAATDKLKGTFFSLVNSGVFYGDTLHPLTCKKIYCGADGTAIWVWDLTQASY